MKWISVKDRLPDLYQDILLYYCKYWNFDKEKSITIGYYQGKGLFVYSGGSIDPTHWMPLPKPPKEQQ